MTIFESIADFSKRTGLPEHLIRSYVKQGKIPFVLTGKSHVRVHVDAGVEALKEIAAEQAASRAADMPAQINIVHYASRSTKGESSRQYRGRVPDAVKKKMKA